MRYKLSDRALKMKSMHTNLTLRKTCGNTIEVTPRCSEHLSAHPDLEKILVAVLLKVKLTDSPFLEQEVDMGEIVGQSSRVATPAFSPQDEMMFAHRLNRFGASRVIEQSQLGDETSIVSVILKRVRPSHFHLITAWVGTLARKEPWDPTISSECERQKCLEFWCQNALIYDPKVMGPIYKSTWSAELEKVDIRFPLLPR